MGIDEIVWNALLILIHAICYPLYMTSIIITIILMLVFVIIIIHIFIMACLYSYSYFYLYLSIHPFISMSVSVSTSIIIHILISIGVLIDSDWLWSSNLISISIPIPAFVLHSKIGVEIMNMEYMSCLGCLSSIKGCYFYYLIIVYCYSYLYLDGYGYWGLQGYWFSWGCLSNSVQYSECYWYYLNMTNYLYIISCLISSSFYYYYWYYYHIIFNSCKYAQHCLFLLGYYDLYFVYFFDNIFVDGLPI